MSIVHQQVEKPKQCDCVAWDRYDCWRLRYNLRPTESVHTDGGPCGCSCHDEADDAEWDQD